MEALTGLVSRYSKNDQPPQQQPHPQQSDKGKGPAHERGYQKKGIPPGGR